MAKQRKISTIRFFREEAPRPPSHTFDIGFIKIDGKWMRDRVEIDGKVINCSPAVDFRAFYKMLSFPGLYYPFTCTCDLPWDADIDNPVRCLHKDNLIIMVLREPLINTPPCDTCPDCIDDKCKYDFLSGECPVNGPFKYYSLLFDKEKFRQGLEEMNAQMGECRYDYPSTIWYRPLQRNKTKMEIILSLESLLQ